MTMTKKRKAKFKPGQKVVVSYYDSEKRERTNTGATLHYYSSAAGCWYFEQPCPVVWAYPEDMEPAPEEKSFEQVAIGDFLETGEVSGLLALADYLTERDEKPELVALIRSVDSRSWEDVKFFAEHAGHSYRPGVESQEEGQLRGAIRLTHAENWLSERMTGQDVIGSVDVEWEEDANYDPMDYDDGYNMPAVGWECQVWVYDGKRWVYEAGLSGITFAGDGELDLRDPYVRVVEAELALELMPD